MSKPFSVTAYRKRLGLTQRALGVMLHLGVPTNAERTVRKWEGTERGTTTTADYPSTQTVLLMMVIEKVWRMYHAKNRTKKALRALLPAELRERKP